MSVTSGAKMRRKTAETRTEDLAHHLARPSTVATTLRASWQLTEGMVGPDRIR